MRLGNLGVGQTLDNLHGSSSADGTTQRPFQKKPTTSFCLVNAASHPGTKQAVTASQMMIQKTQGRAYRKGVQPQCNLRQFHGHRVLVHAVDAALEYHAPDNVTVVKLFCIDSPATFFGIAHDRIADDVDPLGQWRGIAVPCSLCLRHRHDYPVGKIINEIDQEMSRTHGRVAYFQFQDLLGRVEPPQSSDFSVFWQIACLELGNPGLEGVHT